MTQPTLQSDSKKSTGLHRWIGAVCLLLVIVAALHSADRSIGGGDTWVAMTCGRYTVGPWAEDQPNRTWQMHLLDRLGIHITKRDFFSAKSRPFVPGDKDLFGWVNQNWLTHVMFYKLKTLWGTTGDDALKGEDLIVVYKFLQAIFTALFMYLAARALGAHPVLAAAATAFGMLLSRSYIDMRPNMTTIFLASIMMYLLARWKRGRWKSLFWMIPVMIVWSNVHGGFIYAIMIFGLMSGGHCIQKIASNKWPDRFVAIPGRSLIALLVSAVVVTIIPAVFSPFGFENLSHPFIVATGAEGKIWRQVSEWHPIYKDGFGNVLPYFFFLGIFSFSVLIWGITFLFSPHQPKSQRHRARSKSTGYWPQIDLAQLGVIAITLYMSIQSRRFVFLGGVVLAPFLAGMAQDIIDMILIKHRAHSNLSTQTAISEKPSWPRWFNVLLGIAAAVSSVAIALVFVLCMWDTYYAPPKDGRELSVFRRMVGIRDQPVQAMAFINENKIGGVIFNEWNHGGFIAFNQDPDPQTGEPRCKVYKDGRAQAAYTLEHFQRWISMRNIGGRTDPALKQTLQSLLHKLNLSEDDPDVYEKLVRLFNFDPLQMRSPNYDKEAKQYRDLIVLSQNEPRLYSALLKNDGVTAFMVHRDSSRKRFVYDLLLKSGEWAEVYVDERYGLLLRKDAPVNQRFLKTPISQRKYPSPFLKTFVTGYLYCRYSQSPQMMKQGLDMLMTLEPKYYLAELNLTIAMTADRLGLRSMVIPFLEKRYRHYRQAVDDNIRLGQLGNYNSLVQLCDLLYSLYRKENDPGKANEYRQQSEQYRKQMRNFFHDEMKEGWLW